MTQGRLSAKGEKKPAIGSDVRGLPAKIAGINAGILETIFIFYDLKQLVVMSSRFPQAHQ
jgi:hypothetical protein